MSTANTAGFFTLGVPPERYHLPHPRLGLPVILLIRRVLLRAFELLRENNYNLAAASEDQVTAALRATIENDLRQSGEVSGFNKRKFETVIRQGQWTNYDGTRLTKAPDLFFKLRDDESEPRPVLSEFEGLFIEAKPVDSTHPVGSKYCDDGLVRFVRGDYAWAMQEAMMLAYARDGRTIAGHLIPAITEAAIAQDVPPNVANSAIRSKPRQILLLARKTSLATIQIPNACLVTGAAACAEAEALHVSQHRRDFQWLPWEGPGHQHLGVSLVASVLGLSGRQTTESSRRCCRRSFGRRRSGAGGLHAFGVGFLD